MKLSLNVARKCRSPSFMCRKLRGLKEPLTEVWEKIIALWVYVIGFARLAVSLRFIKMFFASKRRDKASIISEAQQFSRKRTAYCSRRVKDFSLCSSNFSGHHAWIPDPQQMQYWQHILTFIIKLMLKTIKYIANFYFMASQYSSSDTDFRMARKQNRISILYCVLLREASLFKSPKKRFQYNFKFCHLCKTYEMLRYTSGIVQIGCQRHHATKQCIGKVQEHLH